MELMLPFVLGAPVGVKMTLLGKQELIAATAAVVDNAAADGLS